MARARTQDPVSARRAAARPGIVGARVRPPAPKLRAKKLTSSAEALLERALKAKTPRARGVWARRGLALRGPIDRTTQAMLLRQLYLTYYEQRRFGRALEIANQLVDLGVLPDVAHQDAARARLALGDIDGAAGHLRLAARVSPPTRRAFHWWTLGSMYLLADRYDEAAAALERAARWGTTDKPLYQGHLAVARCAGGKQVDELPTLIDRLAGVPAGQGYGRYVLGQLAYYDRRWDEARRYLESFVRRTLQGKTAMNIALEGEVAHAKRLLSTIYDP